MACMKFTLPPIRKGRGDLSCPNLQGRWERACLPCSQNYSRWAFRSSLFYRPQTKFAKVMFLQVSVCPQGGEGACVVPRGGVHGCSGGRAWFYSGGRAWFYSGAFLVLFGGCMVLFGGMRGFIQGQGGVRGFIWGGMHGFIWGGMRGFIRGLGRAWFYSGGHAWFYLGGCAWFYSGGVRGFIPGGMHGFFSFFGYNEIRSMSGRYASYWNAFLWYLLFLDIWIIWRTVKSAISGQLGSFCFDSSVSTIWMFTEWNFTVAWQQCYLFPQITRSLRRNGACHK